MSPEQCKGVDDRLTSASDIYSLGAILYEIITGRPPFEAATPWMTMQMTLHKEPEPPSTKASSVDLNLERVVMWCLEKDPFKRYHTASSLGADLKRVLKGEKPVGPSRSGFFSRLFRSV
jgi:serine/threonine-protein kinase